MGRMNKNTSIFALSKSICLFLSTKQLLQAIASILQKQKHMLQISKISQMVIIIHTAQ